VGAWGAGPFENDDAGDWVWELEDDSNASVVRDALEAVVLLSPDDEIEVSEASTAIAAAEIVASARGTMSQGLPTEAQVWIGQYSSIVDEDLLALATGAVERVSIASELKDLWDETENLSWSENVSDLLSRLRAAR
jgi:hypothetical protein